MNLPTTITLAAVDFVELNSDANGMCEMSRQLVVNSQAMFELAGEELISVKSRIKAVEKKRMSITAPLTAAHKATMELFRAPLLILEEAKKYYERGMLSYTAEQERQRREEQAKLDAIAKAERDRLAAEATAKLAESENLTGKAAQDALYEADRIAEQLRNTHAVVVEQAKPESQGNSVRKTWKGECTDLMETIKFVAANPAYLKLLQIDQTALNALAKSQQDSFSVTGCRAFQESSIASRTK